MWLSVEALWMIRQCIQLPCPAHLYSRLRAVDEPEQIQGAPPMHASARSSSRSQLQPVDGLQAVPPHPLSCMHASAMFSRSRRPAHLYSRLSMACFSLA